MKKLVIIPTYNEIENISRMIDVVLALEGDFHMLVIDDGSPDGTAAVVRERQAEFADRLHLIEREGKLGLGTTTTISSRWIATSRTILRTCSDSMIEQARATMWLSAHDMCRA